MAKFKAAKPGARGDALLRNPQQYLSEARDRARREILTERQKDRIKPA